MRLCFGAVSSRYGGHPGHCKVPRDSPNYVSPRRDGGRPLKRSRGASTSAKAALEPLIAQERGREKKNEDSGGASAAASSAGQLTLDAMLPAHAKRARELEAAEAKKKAGQAVQKAAPAAGEEEDDGDWTDAHAYRQYTAPLWPPASSSTVILTPPAYVCALFLACMSNEDNASVIP
eukprot:COSAG05_NODE_3490_length_2029_cov_2.334715_2_plen_177_part_00